MATTMGNYPGLHEDDSNSTYCEKCGCRITGGQCKHGVRPPWTLTKDNIRERLVIKNKEHPEWGEFSVTRDRNGWIYQRGSGGGAMLWEGDFHRWHIVRGVDGKRIERKVTTRPAKKPRLSR